MKANSLFLLAILIVIFVVGVVVMVRSKPVDSLPSENGQPAENKGEAPAPPQPGKGAGTDPAPATPPATPPPTPPKAVDKPGEPFFKDGLYHPRVGLLPAGARTPEPSAAEPYNPVKRAERIRERQRKTEEERKRQEEILKNETKLVRQNVPDLEDDQAVKLNELYLWHFNELGRRQRIYQQKGVEKTKLDVHRELWSLTEEKARAFLDPGQQEAFRAWMEKIIQ